MSKKVLIAGSGVNGLILAKVLQNNKVPFTIIEKNHQFFNSPDRTVALTSDSIRFLNSLDKDLDINAWSTPVHKMVLYQDANLNLTLSKEEEKISTICQLDKLHGQLLKGLEEHIVMGQEIYSIDKSDDGIVVTTKNDTFEGSLIFACDGINSPIRALKQFRIDEWYYGQKVYIATIEAEHNNIAHQFFSKSGTLAFLPLTIEENFFSLIFCTNTTGDPLEELNTLIQENAQNLKIDKIKSVSGGIDLKHHRAHKLYLDNVILCGDAANSFHPMAGQGLNLGIGDIMFIAENLNDILHLKQDALESYSSKRNAKNIQMTWIIQSLFGAFGNSSGISKSIINEGMKILDTFPKAKEKIIEFANKN